jgi:hypothetical protein
VPRFKKHIRAIPLPSLRVFVACKKGETYLVSSFIETVLETHINLKYSHRVGAAKYTIRGLMVAECKLSWSVA